MSRLPKVLALLTAVCALLICASVCASAKKASVTGLPEETAGNIRVQFYSDSLVRIEQKGENGFSDDATISVQDRTGWSGVATERTENDGLVTLKTPRYTVTVPEDAEDASGVRVLDENGKEIWTPKDCPGSHVFLPSPSETPAAWAFNDTPRVTPSEKPFIADKKASDDDMNGWKYEKDAHDYYVFIPGGSAFQLRSDFVHLTGRAPITPLKTLGLWFSRDHAYTDEEFLRLADDFREHGFPIDIIVIDTDWKDSKDGTGYDFNGKYFPDPKAFFEKAKENNIDTLMNDHAHESDKSLLSKEQLDRFNDGIRGKLETGMSAWWYDSNRSHALKSPFEKIHGDLMGQYMYNWISADEKHKIDPAARPYLLSSIYYVSDGGYGEPAHVSVHRNGIQRTGDTASTAASLKNEVENMVRTGADTTLAYYSSDIGGYFGDPDEHMFARWTQYGALSPIMRYHSTDNVPGRIPFEKSETTEKVCREYIRMRYRLTPLFYTLAYENHAEGLPIARRLDFYYPDAPEAKANDQYLLGKNILIAPLFGADNTETVTGPNKDRIDTRGVYIPEGSWVNAFTGETIKGPKKISVSMGAEQSPIFVRQGSLTVLTEPGDHADASDWKNIVLDIYAGSDTKDVTRHYEDDGRTLAYRKGAYRLTTYTTEFDKDGNMTLKTEIDQPEKDPIGFTNRTVILRLHTSKEPSISLNGEELKVSDVKKDASAYPFAVEGGSPDGDVYTAIFVIKPDEGYTVTAEYK